MARAMTGTPRAAVKPQACRRGLTPGSFGFPFGRVYPERSRGTQGKTQDRSELAVGQATVPPTITQARLWLQRIQSAIGFAPMLHSVDGDNASAVVYVVENAVYSHP